MTSVRLSVTFDGPATLIVYRSNARGLPQRVTSPAGLGGADVIELPLASFGDGGWYWFDVIAPEAAVLVTDGYWDVAVPSDHVPGTTSLAITTFNRPDYCAAQIASDR